MSKLETEDTTFTGAISRAFSKARETWKGQGSKARLRVNQAAQERELDTVVPLDTRRRTRANQAAVERHQAKAARRRAKKASNDEYARTVATAQSRVLVGEVGTEAMRRNVQASLLNEVRAEIILALAKEWAGSDRPHSEFAAEVERRVQFEAARLGWAS